MLACSIAKALLMKQYRSSISDEVSHGSNLLELEILSSPEVWTTNLWSFLLLEVSSCSLLMHWSQLIHWSLSLS
jgi:hypothetical protein